MKILAINWQDWKAPQKGGAEFYLKEILTRLAGFGHDVTLLCSGYKGAAHHEILDGIRIVRTGSRNTFNFHLYGSPIRAYLRANDFDVVIDDLNKIPFYTPLWRGSIPVAGMLMHVFRREIFKEAGFLPGSYVYLTESLIPRVYKKGLFSCLGASGREELAGMGMDREKIEVLQVGVNPVFKPGGKKEKNLIATVTRLMQYKCIDHLVYAVSMLAEKGLDIRCEIAGAGPDRKRLEKLTTSLGLSERVSFLGWVPLNEVAELYRRASVAVQPSAKEGWGFLATDAGACATPVVAARVPGLTDSVIDGKTGFLYEHGNIKEMAGYIEKLLLDASLREKMGAENLEWSKSLTWDKVARRVEKLLFASIAKERS